MVSIDCTSYLEAYYILRFAFNLKNFVAQIFRYGYNPCETRQIHRSDWKNLALHDTIYNAVHQLQTSSLP